MMTEQLSVKLMAGAAYVYGTVNGAVADFTLTAPTTWTAVVPKAEDGVYVIAITAYNELGTPAHYETTLYRPEGLIPPKTDWKAADYYNTYDLNRVELNTQYIADQLTAVGYPASLESVVADREIADVEFAPSLSRVERNVESLMLAFIPLPGVQQSKAWVALQSHDYTDANRLERNLLLLHTWLIRTMDGFRYCGTFSCGEGGEIY